MNLVSGNYFVASFTMAIRIFWFSRDSCSISAYTVASSFLDSATLKLLLVFTRLAGALGELVFAFVALFLSDFCSRGAKELFLVLSETLAPSNLSGVLDV